MADYLQSCLARERTLIKILNNAPEEHIDLVDKMQKSLKVSQKNNSNMLKELAAYEANKIKESSPKPLYCIVHRKEGDSDFISAFLKELDDNVRNPNAGNYSHLLAHLFSGHSLCCDCRR